MCTKSIKRDIQQQFTGAKFWFGQVKCQRFVYSTLRLPPIATIAYKSLVSLYVAVICVWNASTARNKAVAWAARLTHWSYFLLLLHFLVSAGIVWNYFWGVLRQIESINRRVVIRFLFRRPTLGFYRSLLRGGSSVDGNESSVVGGNESGHELQSENDEIRDLALANENEYGIVEINDHKKNDLHGNDPNGNDLKKQESEKRKDGENCDVGLRLQREKDYSNVENDLKENDRKDNKKETGQKENGEKENDPKEHGLESLNVNQLGAEDVCVERKNIVDNKCVIESDITPVQNLSSLNANQIEMPELNVITYPPKVPTYTPYVLTPVSAVDNTDLRAFDNNNPVLPDNDDEIIQFIDDDCSTCLQNNPKITKDITQESFLSSGDNIITFCEDKNQLQGCEINICVDAADLKTPLESDTKLIETKNLSYKTNNLAIKPKNRNQNTDENDDENFDHIDDLTTKWQPWYIILSWQIATVTNVITLYVTIIYFTVIYKHAYPDGGISFRNVQTHGITLLLVTIDFILSLYPVRLLHCIYPIFYIFVYIIFTAIYWAFNGNAIYPKILDWNNPGQTILYDIPLVLFAVVLHTAVYLAYKLKLFLMRRFMLQ